MTLCDSNIGLALALPGHVHHAAARRWLNGVEGVAAVFFCRATQQAFLRLLTNAAVLAPYGNQPLTNRQAWAVYEAMLIDDPHRLARRRTRRSRRALEAVRRAGHRVAKVVDGRLSRGLCRRGRAPSRHDRHRVSAVQRADAGTGRRVPPGVGELIAVTPSGNTEEP